LRDIVRYARDTPDPVITSIDNLIDRIVSAPLRLDHARTRRVLDYIDLHLEDDFTISDLAQVAHLSEFHFARVFATTDGQPPQRYVQPATSCAAKKMIACRKASFE
jgi:AraC family transcriptional regulator